jgi:para-aminobenzoate synthetase / 4-amino-4-deoxychorismate lyase
MRLPSRIIAAILVCRSTPPIRYTYTLLRREPESSLTKYTPFPEEFYALLRRSGSVLLQTSRFDEDNERSLLFVDPAEILCARKPDEIAEVFARVEDALRRGRYVAGYASFDCGALAEVGLVDERATGPLLWFGVYEKAFVFDHRRGKFEGDAPLSAAVEEMSDEVRALRLAMSASEHAEKVAAIHDYIRAGDTYQVNLTTRVELEYSGSAVGLFLQLGRQQRVAYSAFIADGERCILSFSPELFYRAEGGRITTRPMKGTAARGRTPEEDQRTAEWLAKDTKNCSENLMIVDLLRNDLGRVCEFGTVSVDELFATEKYETVWQMTSTVGGKLRGDVSQVEVFKHLFPCGSVTGAPKLRTMEIIRELEQGPRGVYTGAIGYFAPNGSATFNVAIRTVALKDGHGEMGIGSGIVIDSVAEHEYEECKLKAKFLTERNAEFQLIEALLWDGEYRRLSMHMDRMESSAGYFGFEFDKAQMIEALKAYGERLQAGARYKVRLLLDRAGKVKVESTGVESSAPSGKIVLASERTSSADRFLFHKTTNRQMYDRLFREAAKLGYDDVLFMNERNEITEGAISNLFIVVGDQWYTPPLNCGVLPGIFRRHVLETNADASEKVLTLKDLEAADAVYICNAVRGMRKVKLETRAMVAKH